MNEVDFDIYVNVSTPLLVGKNVDAIIKLQNASKSLFKRFIDNQMKTNPDKCHFICCYNVKINIMVEKNN